MSNEITTRSTSLKTAVSDPIELRVTDRVRLVFVPVLVENSTHPEASVDGYFVYQRKTVSDTWIPIQTVSLSTLKSNEGFKLELSSEEVLNLFRGLESRYHIHKQHGVPRGEARFVRLGASLTRFLSLSESELTLFLNAHNEDAAMTLAKLIKWLANSSQRGDTLKRFMATAHEQLPDLNAVLGLAAVKEALAQWEMHKANVDEEFWQKTLAERSFVLSQVFAYPVIVIQQKAYVGGKQITNTQGNTVDFFGRTESSGSAILIEIKTPGTGLLGGVYRNGVYPLSRELSGAISQILRYRQSLINEFQTLTSGLKMVIDEPRCIVIAGANTELDTDEKKQSFGLVRERLQGVTVITYDELFGKLRRLLRLFESSSPADG